MTKSIVIKYYSDPEHGWGCVKLEMLRELQIAQHISEYSRLKGKINLSRGSLRPWIICE